MFDLDIKVSSNEYFDLIRKLECLTAENEHLKGLNENQMNMIIDLRNEITDLKRQNGDLCELVGKTKKESKDLKGTISRMHGGCQRAVELRRLLDELFDIKPNELVYDDEIRQRMKDLRADAKDLQEQNQILKDKLKSVCETCDVPDNCVNASEAVLKDADAKIQSANDKAANAKKEAKQAKETAERYREENFVLSRKIDQIKRLNDELIKELARKGED